jgi:asparagine synthetase B (glutamine-hydrolysing)
VPGIFGGVGQTPEVFSALQKSFTSIWGRSEVYKLNDGLLGGHAFGTSAVYINPDGSAIAVDGELSIYKYAKQHIEGDETSLFQFRGTELCRTPICKGNLVFVDSEARIWRISADVSGSFPLYYAIYRSGLLLSSSLRILRRIIVANPDPIGVIEFLREGYTFNERCLAEGVKRVLPGQIITYDAHSKHLSVTEGSRLWTEVGSPEIQKKPSVLIDAAWQHLTTAIARSIGEDEKNVLMLSGGWDSRTLLAAMFEHCRNGYLETFTHGDGSSREIRLAHRISNSLKIPHRHANIDDRIYDLAELKKAFARTENVVFPHWHRSSQVISQAGISCLIAGVYGEILGGHYGPAMLQRGSGKIISVLQQLIGYSRNYNLGNREYTRKVLDFLRLSQIERPWYLHEDWWRQTPDPLAAINNDIETAIHRFQARGISTALQLFEAFITEHRGTQYINAQILSARSCLDISMPYTDKDLLEFATRIPFVMKVHNRMNQRMLRRYSSKLLRFPCAATLVPASAPIMIQEISRFTRKCLEEATWYCHFKSSGAIDYPRLGWVSFEFARRSMAFQNIVEDLRCSWWDKEAMKKLISDVASGTWQQPVHPVSDQLMKIYTVDLMFR